jgi:small basic protein (TIGR04137 family)
MSIDHSLKIKGALKRHRNVLTRAERVGQLKDEERWSEEQSVFGLPKIAHRKSHAGKKEKEEAAKEAAAVTPEGQAAPAGAKPATLAGGVTPAKTAGAPPAKEKAAEKPKEKGKQKATGKT